MYGDGRVYLRKGGKTYWIAFNRYGKEVRMSAGTDKISVARKKLRDEVRKSRGDDWVEPRDRKITIGELVSDLLQHYRGQRMENFATATEAQWKSHLQARFEHVPAHRFNTAMQNDYRTARFAEKAALATVQRELQVLRRAFHLGADQEPPKVARVPKFRIDKEDNACKEFFSADQVNKIREAASKEGQHARAFVELAHALGWRRGELLGLRVKNFDLLAGTVRIDTSKSGEPRECVLTDRIKMFVRPLVVNHAPEDLVFSFDKDEWKYIWRRIAKFAGVRKFHSFRRTSARDKRAAGVAESVVMKEQGWETDAVFRRYAIVNREDMKDSQRKLEEFQSQTRTNLGQFEGSSDGDQEQVQ